MSTNSKDVAFLVAAEGIEEIELTDPRKACVDAGWSTTLVSTTAGQVDTVNHLEKSNSYPVDATVESVSVDQFDGLVLPGGVANPDALRMNSGAVRLVSEFIDSGKPVAAICHAAWMLVEADVVRGRRLTSFPSVRTDVLNAGGEWVDEEVVVDGNLITSRKPDDLPAFNQALLAAVDA